MEPHHDQSQCYSSKNPIRNAPLEEAINIVGFGRHQVAFACISGLLFLAAGVQNGITAFILPSLKCDMGLTSSQMGLLNAAFLLGGTGSGFVWGVVVDSIGRQPVVVYGLFMDAIVTFVSSLSPNFYVFIAFRFLNGFMIGGPSSVGLMYVGEWVPQRFRAKTICYVGLTWSVSWVVAAGLAWFIIPFEVLEWPSLGIQMTAWRALLVVVGFIEAIPAILLSMMHESPKFYVSKGRPDLALDVLAKIYAQNKGLTPADYPVKSLEHLQNTTPKTIKCSTSSKSVWRPVVKTLKQFKSLLNPPVLQMTSLTCFLWFTNLFGYYGLGLWMPELSNRYKTHEASNRTSGISVCDLSQSLVGGLTASADIGCARAIDPSVFINTLISASFLVGGNIVAAMLSSTLPRNLMPVLFMFGASASVMALFLVRTSMEHLVVNTLFQLNIGTANLVQNALIVDIFPVEVSGIAVCITIMTGRIGAMISNVVLGLLMDISCSVPIVMCAIFIAAGGVASMFIPLPYEEPSKKPVSVAVISRDLV